jgi:ferritin-like metal-binding protein YciE
MDASPDVLADTVRAKRHAIDNDLELLRVRMQQAKPRIDARKWARTALPVLGAAAAATLLVRRRRSMTSLDDLLAYGLTDLYQSERLLVPVLAKMSLMATSPELQRAFEAHRAETEGHVDRLVRVFRSIGAKRRRGGTSAGVAGIVAENEHLLKRKADPDVRDAWLIAAAQRVEHLEIATYGALRTYAETLGHQQAAALLQQTLDEEKATDEKLTQIAKRFVNLQSIRTLPVSVGGRRPA